MAKYLSSPHYSVGDIVFDINGVYETEDITEIKRLDALVPTWIRRIDEPKKEPEEPQKDEKATEEPQKPAPKAPRKAANASAK